MLPHSQRQRHHQWTALPSFGNCKLVCSTIVHVRPRRYHLLHDRCQPSHNCYCISVSLLLFVLLTGFPSLCSFFLFYFFNTSLPLLNLYYYTAGRVFISLLSMPVPVLPSQKSSSVWGSLAAYSSKLELTALILSGLGLPVMTSFVTQYIDVQAMPTYLNIDIDAPPGTQAMLQYPGKL